MTDINYTRRFIHALILAVLLGVLFGIVNTKAEAPDCESPNPDEACMIIYYPGICSYLEPYSWWWYALNCGAGFTAETVTYEFLPDDRLRIIVDRELPNGERLIIVYHVPVRGRDR